MTAKKQQNNKKWVQQKPQQSSLRQPNLHQPKPHQPKPHQLSMFTKQNLAFGGSLLKRGHARSPRPLTSKQLVHTVLKSDRAVGELRLTKQKKRVNEIVLENINAYQVRIHKMAIAENHIHLLISFKSRQKYFNWLRRITGLIARLMLKAEKGRPSAQSYWTYRPFTRVVYWGQDFRGVMRYVANNARQAIGFLPSIPAGYLWKSTA